MPLYEYRCESCGHTFEKIQKFSDPPEDTCPTCGGAVKKLLSSPAIQFKGSGWYITDYAKKSTDGGSSAAQQDTSASADKSDTPAPSATTASSDSPKKD
jgi:putative FmdB family regulatory protein